MFLILSFTYRNGIALYVVLLALNMRAASIIFAFFFPQNIHFAHPLSWCSPRMADLNSTLRYIGCTSLPAIESNYWYIVFHRYVSASLAVSNCLVKTLLPGLTSNGRSWGTLAACMGCADGWVTLLVILTYSSNCLSLSYYWSSRFLPSKGTGCSRRWVHRISCGWKEKIGLSVIIVITFSHRKIMLMILYALDREIGVAHTVNKPIWNYSRIPPAGKRRRIRRNGVPGIY